MNEPAAIWSTRRIVFDRDISLTQNLILSQGSAALAATLHRINSLRSLTATSPLQGTYRAPEIPSILSDLCHQAGLASTILFHDGKRGRKESEYAYALRRQRVEYVNFWCSAQGVSTPTLKDRTVRNSLTHIDEHLADALSESNNVGWFVDVAVDTRSQFSSPDGITAKFVRSYIRQEDLIVNLNKEISLEALRRDCAAVLAVVFGQGGA